MATAYKRGNKYRCLVYVGRDPSGKRKYKSFTGYTKQEAELAASVYDADQEDLTVQEAISNYIAIKEAVLSPSTITCYKAYERNCYDALAKIRVADLRSKNVQAWVSEMVKNKKSAKYIRNVYGLLTAAIRLYYPQKAFSATLPKKAKKYSYVPTAAEIWQILPYFDEEMQRAIMLAAFCSLRCGEICALTSDDLSGNVLTINKALARTHSGEYVLKDPKTYHSTRTVVVPEVLLKKLQPINGRYISLSPMMVSNVFHKTAVKKGICFRFHDLRHFFASELAKTMPLAVIERMGGWSPGSPVLRQIYIGAQEAEMDKNMAAAAAVFDALQH